MKIKQRHTLYHYFCSNCCYHCDNGHDDIHFIIRGQQGQASRSVQHFCTSQTPSSIPFWLCFSSQFPTTFNKVNLQAFISKRKIINEESSVYNRMGRKPFQKTSVSCHSLPRRFWMQFFMHIMRRPVTFHDKQQSLGSALRSQLKKQGCFLNWTSIGRGATELRRPEWGLMEI